MWVSHTNPPNISRAELGQAHLQEFQCFLNRCCFVSQWNWGPGQERTQRKWISHKPPRQFPPGSFLHVWNAHYRILSIVLILMSWDLLQTHPPVFLGTFHEQLYPSVRIPWSQTTKAGFGQPYQNTILWNNMWWLWKQKKGLGDEALERQDWGQPWSPGR